MERIPQVLYSPRKTLPEAYHTWFFGLHHLYLGNYFLYIAYFFSMGLYGLGWVRDAFRMKNLVEIANTEIIQDKKSVEEAFICWVPFGGVVGLHHFYLSMGRHHFDLKEFLVGILYIFTFGLFGFGWFLDAFFMQNYVNSINAIIAKNVHQKQELLRKTREDQEELDNKLALIQERKLKDEENRRIREDQDIEFIKALSEDEERDRIRLQEEQYQNFQRLEIQKQRESMETYATEKLSHFPEEPNHSRTEVINLVFRLPDGQRICRRFLKSDSIGLIREWVDIQRKARYISGDHWNIVSNFPKKVFLQLDAKVGDVFTMNQVLAIEDYE